MVLANAAARAGAKGRIEAGVELADGEIVTSLTSVEVGILLPAAECKANTTPSLSAGPVPLVHVEQPSIPAFPLTVLWTTRHHAQAFRDFHTQNLYRELSIAVPVFVKHFRGRWYQRCRCRRGSQRV